MLAEGDESQAVFFFFFRACFKAARLDRIASLTFSCCDILVSKLIYNFVCKRALAVIVLPFFLYFLLQAVAAFFLFIAASLFCQLKLCGVLFFAWLAVLFGRSGLFFC